MDSPMTSLLDDDDEEVFSGAQRCRANTWPISPIFNVDSSTSSSSSFTALSSIPSAGDRSAIRVYSADQAEHIVPSSGVMGDNPEAVGDTSRVVGDTPEVLSDFYPCTETRRAGQVSRRNVCGKLSYSELITQAIDSAPGRRLTLAQIYDWMVANVPYFKDKGNSCSSAGWKNSIRHNLSLHSRFKRVANETSGKSSWWMLNYDSNWLQGGGGKTSRDRAATMSDVRSYEKKRDRRKRKADVAPSSGRVTLSEADSSSKKSPVAFLEHELNPSSQYRPPYSSNSAANPSRYCDPYDFNKFQFDAMQSEIYRTSTSSYPAMTSSYPTMTSSYPAMTSSYPAMTVGCGNEMRCNQFPTYESSQQVGISQRFPNHAISHRDGGKGRMYGDLASYQIHSDTQMSERLRFDVSHCSEVNHSVTKPIGMSASEQHTHHSGGNIDIGLHKKWVNEAQIKECRNSCEKNDRGSRENSDSKLTSSGFIDAVPDFDPRFRQPHIEPNNRLQTLPNFCAHPFFTPVHPKMLSLASGGSWFQWKDIPDPLKLSSSLPAVNFNSLSNNPNSASESMIFKASNPKTNNLVTNSYLDLNSYSMTDGNFYDTRTDPREHITLQNFNNDNRGELLPACSSKQPLGGSGGEKLQESWSTNHWPDSTTSLAGNTRSPCDEFDMPVIEPPQQTDDIWKEILSSIQTDLPDLDKLEDSPGTWFPHAGDCYMESEPLDDMTWSSGFLPEIMNIVCT